MVLKNKIAPSSKYAEKENHSNTTIFTIGYENAAFEQSDESSTTNSTSDYSETREDGKIVSSGYKSYRRRWLVLLSVLLLNIANYSGWISFAAVTSKAADFYQVQDSKIQLIVTVSYMLGMPACVAATFIFAKWGLRPSLLIGAFMTFTGSALCCLSTMPKFRDLIPTTSWYWLAFFGQAITGLASPLIASVPAKVSQHWFDERQRPIATAILGLSNPMGLVVGQALTPLLVPTSDWTPVMNAAWFAPAAAGALLTAATVTSSRPPTPPSRSAALETDQEKRGFLLTLRSLLTNWRFLVLIFVVGGAQGYVSAQQVKNEPVMCSLGYSNGFSGLTASLVFIGGIFGSVFVGFAINYVDWQVRLTKLLCLPLGLVMCALGWVMTKVNMHAAVVTLHLMLGFLAMGMYPTLLEFSVESTYPNDESVVVALILVFSSVQGVALLYLDDAVAKPAIDDKFANETCTQGDVLGGSYNVPLDHDLYVILLNAFGMVFLAVYLVGFNTKFKRTEANRGGGGEEVENEGKKDGC